MGAAAAEAGYESPPPLRGKASPCFRGLKVYPAQPVQDPTQVCFTLTTHVLSEFGKLFLERDR